MKKKTRNIEVEMEIDAPPDAVWKALTEAEELTRWFPPYAGVNDDGSVWMSWDGENKFSGDAELDASARRARFVYKQPPPGRDPSTLTPEDFVAIATEYRLETRAGKTVLRLVHSGFGEDESWDDLYDGTRTGWAFELRGLKHYLENHRGRDRLIAWAKVPYDTSREDAWKRLMGPRGLLAEGSLDGASDGSQYAIRTATGDRLEGVVRYFEPPKAFVATVDNLESSFLRIKLEDLYGLREVNLWLSAYRLEPEDVEAIETRWQQGLDELFPSA